VADALTGPDIIRIHPHRVVGFNVGPEHPGFRTREAGADGPVADPAEC